MKEQTSFTTGKVPARMQSKMSMRMLEWTGKCGDTIRIVDAESRVLEMKAIITTRMSKTWIPKRKKLKRRAIKI